MADELFLDFAHGDKLTSVPVTPLALRWCAPKALDASLDTTGTSRCIVQHELDLND